MNPFQAKPPQGGLPKPRPIDAPPEAPQEQQQTLESMNYSGADATCQNCGNFDGQGACTLANDAVEPGGHCNSFTPGEAQESPVAEDTAGMEFAQ